MADIISSGTYLSIANSYADARGTVSLASASLLQAVDTIVLLNDTIPTVDLLSEFYNTYEIFSAQLNSPVNFLSAVRKINNHVINRSASSITNLNQYLADAGIQVPPVWAELCEAAGFSVDAQYISS